jgi:iron complex transport system substrate-binding protein
MPNYSYGGNEDQVLPWDADAITALGGEAPALLNSDSDQTPFEQFAAAKPDVILAPYSGLTQEDYDTLSKIAPVVAYPDGPWATPWQDQLTIIGKALGLPAKAAAIKDEIDSHIADLATQYPELNGKTFLYGAANQPGQLNIYRATDPRVELLTQLGMTVSPSVAALDNGSDAASYFYPLSYEKLGDIDTDVLVAYFGDQAAADEFAKTPAVAAMASVQAGHFAPIIGESYVMASSAPSALSIPWMLDRYVPELAKAASK